MKTIRLSFALVIICMMALSACEEQTASKRSKYLSYEENNGMIEFTMPVIKKSGEKWIKYFQKTGTEINDYGIDIFEDDDLEFTIIKKETVNIVVLRGNLFYDDIRGYINIKAKADSLRLRPLSLAESASLRDFLFKRDFDRLKLNAIVAMHEPVKDMVLVCMNNSKLEGQGCSISDKAWPINYGFALIKPN